VNHHLNQLDSWIGKSSVKKKLDFDDQTLNDKGSNIKLNNFMQLSDAYQAVREIRESGSRISKYTTHVKEVKTSKESLELLLQTLQSP